MSTQTYTVTHSSNFLADRMLNAFKDIVRDSGLDPANLVEGWATLERGILTWLRSGHLQILHMEVWRPDTDALVKRWDFAINYDTEPEDMWEDPDAIRAQIAKAGAVPATCRYRIVASTADGRPDVQGWSNATLRSTDGLTQRSGGASVVAPGMTAHGSYWRGT